ncbi:hypothetical protein D3C87_1707370 [compost metagenome]
MECSLRGFNQCFNDTAETLAPLLQKVEFHQIKICERKGQVRILSCVFAVECDLPLPVRHLVAKLARRFNVGFNKSTELLLYVWNVVAVPRLNFPKSQCDTFLPSGNDATSFPCRFDLANFVQFKAMGSVD